MPPIRHSKPRQASAHHSVTVPYGHQTDKSSPAERSTTPKLCKRCSVLPIAQHFATLTSKQSQNGTGNGSSSGRIPIADYHMETVGSMYKCDLCKFWVESMRLSTPENRFKLYRSKAPHSMMYLEANEDPWFLKAGIDVARKPCPFAWLRVGPKPTKEEPPQPHICITFEPDIHSTYEPGSKSDDIYPRKRIIFEGENGNYDVELVIDWLKKCYSESHPRCSVPETPKVEGLKLIDVQEHRLVLHQPGDRYVALSYVWGKGTGFVSSTAKVGSRLPGKLPQTIADALEFTRAIGLRYLWVDQFCINQHNRTEKDRQIQAMNQVYASAWLTVICLDGSHANYGLPSLSRPIFQTSQPEIKLDCGRLRATYIHSAWDHNGNPPYDMRAWILQEKLLSPRRLIFANHYTSMECQTEVFHDLVNTSPDDTGREVRHDDPYSRADGSGFDLNQKVWEFKKFAFHVSIFSARDITDERDRHDACRGLLKQMTASTGCGFSYGLPHQDFLRSSLWKPHHDHINKRRHGFSTWSWLGSRGRVEYPSWVSNDRSDGPHDRRSDHHLRVLERGGMTAKSDFATRNKGFGEALTPDLGSPASESRVLELQTTTCTFAVKLVGPKHSSHTRQPVQLPGSGVAPGDYWALVDTCGHTVTNDLSDSEEFKPMDVAFRLAPKYSKLLAKQTNKAEFVFVKHWSRLCNGQQGFSSKDVRCDKVLYGYVSALLVVPKNGGRYQRLASITVLAESWLAQGPQEAHIKLV